jgi:hypothetical protein
MGLNMSIKIIMIKKMVFVVMNKISDLFMMRDKKKNWILVVQKYFQNQPSACFKKIWKPLIQNKIIKI